MKQLILGGVAAMVVCVTVGAANTVKVTKFHQSYPYSGKATVEYTVDGTLPANAVAEITLNTDDASATFAQSNVVTGANAFTIDFASSFGGAMVLTNASFVVTIAESGHGGSVGELGGVQLWENGPCWAECNIGASKPEEYGYYFSWGDTVGYTNTGSGWISVKDGTEISFDLNSYPAASAYYEDNSALLSVGYIDSTGNLAPEHDAANVHWGGGWRMPTDAEFSALIINCTTTWITTNGVNGQLVTGKGGYANRSIFLPAGGYGYDSGLNDLGSCGHYWSSAPFSDWSDTAWSLYFYSDYFYRNYENGRILGLPVRPVRVGASYTVTYGPGANGSGSQQTAIKTHGVALTLKGAIFTRSGYTQMGWSTSDGGSKAYDLGAVYISNAAITLYPYWVANPDTHGGVQLWENGPYWAECNVGASKPEEYGYYFWWGDTVGYTNTGSGWISVKDGTGISFTDSGVAASTYGTDSELQWAGYIDATGNLALEHDAAHIHWGGEWRMPTDAEISALVSNCTITWITTNGVNGCLVTGTGKHANRSIFLPAAGCGYDSGRSPHGFYWSSAPESDSVSARYLLVDSSYFYLDYTERYNGQSVRPVRGFAE